MSADVEFALGSLAARPRGAPPAPPAAPPSASLKHVPPSTTRSAAKITDSGGGTVAGRPALKPRPPPVDFERESRSRARMAADRLESPWQRTRVHRIGWIAGGLLLLLGVALPFTAPELMWPLANLVPARRPGHDRGAGLARSGPNRRRGGPVAFVSSACSGASALRSIASAGVRCTSGSRRFPSAPTPAWLRRERGTIARRGSSSRSLRSWRRPVCSWVPSSRTGSARPRCTPASLRWRRSRSRTR